jgi:hypothetical protein
VESARILPSLGEGISTWAEAELCESGSSITAPGKGDSAGGGERNNLESLGPLRERRGLENDIIKALMSPGKI